MLFLICGCSLIAAKCFWDDLNHIQCYHLCAVSSVCILWSACQLVSDNGPQFCLEEFAIFLKENVERHIYCAPSHPVSNSLVKRFVRTFKQALKARELSGLSLQHCVTSFLFGHLTTQHELHVIHLVCCSWDEGCVEAEIYWGLIARIISLSSFWMDSVWWPSQTDMVHGGVLQWSSYVLAITLCWLKQTSLRLWCVIMINCTQPMWQKICHHTRWWCSNAGSYRSAIPLYSSS